MNDEKRKPGTVPFRESTKEKGGRRDYSETHRPKDSETITDNFKPPKPDPDSSDSKQ